MTALHIANFVDAIRSGAALHQPIEEGAKSVLLGHLGNIAQTTGRALRVDATSGHITGDEEAMKSWAREYAPGWAPVVDRKSTRLNSSHLVISYAVFCLKKKEQLMR